jgi:hypothetical protein
MTPVSSSVMLRPHTVFRLFFCRLTSLGGVLTLSSQEGSVIEVENAGGDCRLVRSDHALRVQGE